MDSKHVQQSPADDAFVRWFIEWVGFLKKCSQQIIANGDQHEPMIFIFEKSGNIGVMPIPPFESAEDKEVVAYVHKTLGARTHDFDGVIMVVEAWAAHLDMKDYKMGAISKHPDRYEILLFNGIRGTMQLMADFRINEDRSLGEMTLRDPTVRGETGRFIVGDDGKLDS